MLEGETVKMIELKKCVGKRLWENRWGRNEEGECFIEGELTEECEKGVNKVGQKVLGHTG